MDHWTSNGHHLTCQSCSDHSVTYFARFVTCSGPWPVMSSDCWRRHSAQLLIRQPHPVHQPIQCVQKMMNMLHPASLTITLHEIIGKTILHLSCFPNLSSLWIKINCDRSEFSALLMISTTGFVLGPQTSSFAWWFSWPSFHETAAYSVSIEFHCNSDESLWYSLISSNWILYKIFKSE